ncbi:germination protein M [Seinonella peptonophila]|uniref:Germination protein M n=1 Tax=Seinonella peptonophila TaxID=112248 RepID=A0A1M4TW79_9BACL|nr:GerMN domain-containing protein [Seinonella peptonophila]SHE48708.1 germination protein M [Seinonella peptonophila]
MRFLFRISLWSLLIAFGLSGCSVSEQKNARAIDPPPKEVEQKYEKEVMAHKNPAIRNGMELYFLSDTNYVVPYSLNIPAVKGIAKEAMKYMVQDGPGENLLPKGFSCLLPKGTKINGIDIRGREATVDFSKEFLNYRPEHEEKILDAVTWSLTGFPTVEKVNIRVEGKKLSVMPKKKSLLIGLTRNRGINLELAEGVNITQSMPVTLYFVGQTVDNQTYHVPVTRMVNRQNNVAQVTVNELIRGPMQGSDLIGPIDASVRLKQASIKDQTAMVDFNENLLQYGGKNSVSQDVMTSLLFSITENTTAQKVKVTVNGSQVNVTGNSRLIKQPVERPKQINPSKL